MSSATSRKLNASLPSIPYLFCLCRGEGHGGTEIDEDVMIRLLLVDDQPVVRRGLCLRFQLEPDMQVVGEASTGREALTLAQTLSPDVVLMDIEMPGMDGIEATAALRRVVPQSAVVILSIHTDRQTRVRAPTTRASSSLRLP